MLNNGYIYEVPATRDVVNAALAAGPKADTTVNGVGVSFRTAVVMSVADSVEGLKPTQIGWGFAPMTEVIPGG